ncbi:hypothetical protein, partial [uncultured Olegusella sp.]|uniref:hypothetical protein n=1 Tax=uncultured Olegusella sp. TaxID=1979846 RepID=UPI0026114DEB
GKKKSLRLEVATGRYGSKVADPCWGMSKSLQPEVATQAIYLHILENSQVDGVRKNRCNLRLQRLGWFCLQICTPKLQEID